MIQEKAVSLFLDLKSEYGEEPNAVLFTASKRRFQRYKIFAAFTTIGQR